MGADAALLATLPAWAFGAILLITRAGGACMLLPGVGEAELPATVRLGFVLALTAALLPSLQPLMPLPPADVWRACGMVVAEAITGLWLGWLARLWLMALPMAGQTIAAMIGISNVLQPDPMLGPQTSVLARGLGLAAPVVLLASGLYALPLAAISGSYGLVAPGELLPAADTAETITRGVTDAFSLSLRLSAPFVLAGTVWQVALALISRLVPQLQVYFAALPGQILGGILLVGLLVSAVLAAWQAEVASAYARLPGL